MPTIDASDAKEQPSGYCWEVTFEMFNGDWVYYRTSLISFHEAARSALQDPLADKGRLIRIEMVR